MRAFEKAVITMRALVFFPIISMFAVSDEIVIEDVDHIDVQVNESGENPAESELEQESNQIDAGSNDQISAILMIINENRPVEERFTAARLEFMLDQFKNHMGFSLRERDPLDAIEELKTFDGQLDAHHHDDKYVTYQASSD